MSGDCSWLAKRYLSEVVDASRGVGLGAIVEADLSRWDLLMMIRQGYHEIPAGSDYIPFEDAYTLSARMFALQAFVAKHVLRLPAAQIRLIEQGVRKSESAPDWPGIRSLPGLGLVRARYGNGLGDAGADLGL
jgi:hypothetical protein